MTDDNGKLLDTITLAREKINSILSINSNEKVIEGTLAKLVSRLIKIDGREPDYGINVP